MLPDLLASARELRNPLTVGYATLLSLWLLLGEMGADLAGRDALAGRIRSAFLDLGSATEFAVLTFIAALVGSVLWHFLVESIVEGLMRKFDHPSWDDLIVNARRQVRQYEEYEVTFPRTPGDEKRSYGFGQERHRVPSSHYGTYLQEAVERGEREKGEVVFRVTLAVMLVPVSVSFGFAGGGYWWLATIAVLFVWLDVTYMKHTTLTTQARYELAQVTSSIEHADTIANDWRKRVANSADPSAVESPGNKSPQQQLDEALQRLEGLKTREEDLKRQLARPTARFFGRYRTE